MEKTGQKTNRGFMCHGWCPARKGARHPAVSLALTIVGAIIATTVSALILAYVFGIGDDQSPPPPETTTITVTTP